MYRTTEKDKEIYRKRIIKGAQDYAKYLLNKSFAIVTDDYLTTIVTFKKKEFLHLTGLLVNIGENKYFELCKAGKISRNNIKNTQRHNKNTLMSKTKNIEKITRFIYADASTNLFLTNFIMASEPSNPFPCAIENINENMVLAFTGKNLKAKSLRKHTSNEMYSSSKPIIGIFEIEEAEWTKCIYIRNKQNILENINHDVFSTNLKNYFHI